MAQVRLILREDVGRLGAAGDLVSVKPGYARNYLLKRGIATVATEARIKELEHHRRIITEKQAKELKDLEAVKHKIQSTAIEVTATAGEGGKLFGSVTMQQVAELLAEKGIEVDRRKMSVPDAIKTTGEHTVTVQLRRELAAKLKVTVTSTSEPVAEVKALDSDETLSLQTSDEAAAKSNAAESNGESDGGADDDE
jgi:large subunit ribosomal protein L9